MNKKNILMLCGAIVFAIILGVVLFLIFNPNEESISNEEQPQEFETFLRDAVNEINDLNSILTSDNVSDSASYENENGFMCKDYIGEDEADIISRLNDLYYDPFEEDGYFELIENDETGEENLYVCLPEGCIPREVDYDTSEITIDGEDENARYVNFNGAEYGAALYDGKWKFTFPVTICPLNFEELIGGDTEIGDENN